MVLTFRSSRSEERVVIERDDNGRQRVARATQSEHNRNHWTLIVEHPNGSSWNASYCGDGLQVVVALADMLGRTEHEYKDAKARGDRRPEPMFDPNRRVNDAIAPIVPVRREW